MISGLGRRKGGDGGDEEDKKRGEVGKEERGEYRRIEGKE